MKLKKHAEVLIKGIRKGWDENDVADYMVTTMGYPPPPPPDPPPPPGGGNG